MWQAQLVDGCQPGRPGDADDPAQHPAQPGVKTGAGGGRNRDHLQARVDPQGKSMVLFCRS